MLNAIQQRAGRKEIESLVTPTNVNNITFEGHNALHLLAEHDATNDNLDLCRFFIKKGIHNSIKDPFGILFYF